jgi:hypothetical protein
MREGKYCVPENGYPISRDTVGIMKAERRCMGWVLNGTPRLLWERDSVLYKQEAGWNFYGQDNIAFFGIRTQYLPRNESFTDCAIQAGTTTVPRVIVYFAQI